MHFQQAVTTCFKNYANFSGRAARSQYWYFVLFIFIGGIITTIIDTALVGSDPRAFHPLYTLFELAILVPTIAVAARRLHDIDKSGWWQLIGLIPLIGTVIMILWAVKIGTPGPNRFGDDPLSGQTQ